MTATALRPSPDTLAASVSTITVASVSIDFTRVHKWARGMFAFYRDSDRVAFAKRLCEHEHVDEAVALSTCNRVEIYLTLSAASDEQQLALDHVIACMRERPDAYAHRNGHVSYVDVFDQHVTVRTGRDATRHLARVASGLESARKGDPAILRQVRSAIGLHRGGSAGAVLGRLFAEVVSSARSLEGETRRQIAEGMTRSRIVAEVLATAKVCSPRSSLLITMWGAGPEAEALGAHLIPVGCTLNVAGADLKAAQRAHGAMSRLGIDQSLDGVFSETMFDHVLRNPDFAGCCDVIICTDDPDAPMLDSALIDAILGYEQRKVDGHAPYLAILDLTTRGNVHSDVHGRADVQVMTAADIDQLYRSELELHRSHDELASSVCDAAAERLDESLTSRMLGRQIQAAVSGLAADLQQRLLGARTEAERRELQCSFARQRHERVSALRAQLGIATASRS